ncbi:MAG: penicillin acylase family protein [Gemmatimonadetes bacterium]|nr:penicillin acylase family protein [Gemmatimonadota bacterium]MYG17323.1 penicillin acylase family protein [Gemmatimonadota bacterium]
MSYTSYFQIIVTCVVIPLLAMGCGEEVDTVDSDEQLMSLARASISQIEGELSLEGLQEPVEVIRDRHGIPHIYAQNTDDLFFAQGYVMAQDRLWQMELWRRWREGRLAEIFGPEAFDYDARTRLMMYRGPFDEREWTSYHAEGERIFTAYANGVNAYIDTHADNLPVEFKLTGIQPGRWTKETVVRRWTGLFFPSAGNDAGDEIRLARSVAELGVEEANRRAAPLPWDDLVVPEGLDVTIVHEDIVAAMRKGEGDPLVPGRLPQLELVEPYTGLVPPDRQAEAPTEEQLLEIGSNNWAVSGALSITGQVMVVNDPHRRLENPSLRYYSHLNAPGWNVIGASEPPFVGVTAGHNDRVAWGYTFAGVDVNDVYVEELHPEQPDMVRWQGGWEPLRVITEEIPVKGEEPRVVVLKYSRHGPVFYEDPDNGVVYAVRSITHEPGTAPYLGCFRMAQAESAEDFFERAMFWKVPTHNLVFGDVEGNIAFQVSALTPDREGWNGRLPVPGDGRYEWQGFREDLPREYNPQRGWVGTANNDSHPPDYTGRPVMFHSSRGVEYSRIERMKQLLQPNRKYTVDDHKRIQLDAYSLRAEADIPSFQGWTSDDAEVERARALVADWNGVLDRDSAGAAVWYRWRGEAEAAAYEPETPADERRPLVEAGLRKTVDRLKGELGEDWSQWRYGRLQKSPFTHLLSDAFSLPAVERSGGFGTIAATSVSFRHILDTEDWDRSVFIITPGQSGQPGSPYYGSLLETWGSDEYLQLAFSREAVEALAGHRLTLSPR